MSYVQCINCRHSKDAHRGGVGLCEACMPVGDSSGMRSGCQEFVDPLPPTWARRSVGECATWIETAARQAVALEQQATEIAALKLNRDRLREKVEGLVGFWDNHPSKRLDGPERRLVNEIFGEVLALLAEPVEERK